MPCRAPPRPALPCLATPRPAEPRHAVPCHATPGRAWPRLAPQRHARPCPAAPGRVVLNAFRHHLGKSRTAEDDRGFTLVNHVQRKRSPDPPLSYMTLKGRGVDTFDIFCVNLTSFIAHQEVDTIWLVDSRFSNVDWDLSQPPPNVARSHE